MRDYVREMMDTWTKDGLRVAYDLGEQLINEIELERYSLEMQSIAITGLRHHLSTQGRFPTVDKRQTALDTVRSTERPRLIMEAAEALYRHSGNALVKVQDVLQHLNLKGLDLGVKQPFAVIGTVLASAEEFRKVARNTFEYVGPLEPYAPDVFELDP